MMSNGQAISMLGTPLSAVLPKVLRTLGFDTIF